MRVLALFFIFISPLTYALDTGDGSDGACVWFNETLTQALYNCTTLDITGTNVFDPAVTTTVFIKVQGNVEINGELNLAGALRIRGPGGHNGGLGTALDGQQGEFPAGATAARGRPGQSSIANGSFEACAGAGGSGGRHSAASTVNAAATVNNTAGCDLVTANGGAAPTGSYGDPLQFHTVINGGTGGGSGGGADDDVTQEDGGDGGGGGGALKLYAGGDLIIRNGALIDLSGADGGSTAAGAGGGGGGAGGAILISVLGNMELEATALIDVSGGDGGLAAAGGSDGTAGGVGHIRLEDDDGVIPGVDGTTAPGASLGLNPVAAAAGSGGSGQSSLSLQSDISAGCAIRDDHSAQNLAPLFLILLVSLLAWKTKIDKAASSRVAN